MSMRVLGLLAMAWIGCGGDGSSNNNPDLSTLPDLTPVSVGAMNGCSDSDYVDQTMGTPDDRMIMINSGGKFDFPCMTILAGQAVEFMWKFSSYPLAPGLAPSHSNDPAGTTPTPITMHNTGTLFPITFPDKGFFPFYVTGHDATLLGVVQVK